MSEFCCQPQSGLRYDRPLWCLPAGFGTRDGPGQRVDAGDAAAKDRAVDRARLRCVQRGRGWIAVDSVALSGFR